MKYAYKFVKVNEDVRYDLEISYNGITGRLITDSFNDYRENYIITKSGEVYNISNWRKKKHYVNDVGYPSINIYYGGKYTTRLIHRLVALAYIPNPNNKPCINHIDGNKLNYSIDNLEWCTYSENNYHAFRTGLKKPTKQNSEDCIFTTHTKDEVILVCKMLEQGMSPSQIARAYGFGEPFCLSIYNRITWKEVSKNYKFYAINCNTTIKRQSKYFRPKDLIKINELFDLGFTAKEIAKYFNWEYDEKLRGVLKYYKKYRHTVVEV